jgi:CheY-like chemotaxis protein
MMPNMNGYELLKALRNNRSTQLIPVILLSAKAGEEASIEGIHFLRFSKKKQNDFCLLNS